MSCCGLCAALCGGTSQSASASQRKEGGLHTLPGPESSVTAASHRLAALTSSSPSAVAARDHEYHVVQWKRGIQRHYGKISPRRANMLVELCNNDDLQSSIAYLDAEYKRQGLAVGIKSLEPTLLSINSFSQALTCIAQAGPESIQLLWGSTLLLVKVVELPISLNLIKLRIGVHKGYLATQRYT